MNLSYMRVLLSLLLTFILIACGKPIEPDRDLAYYKQLGDEYYASKDYDVALEAYQNALARAENPILASEVQLAIANTYFADKDYILAIGVYETYVELYPTSPKLTEAYLNLGLAHNKIKESPSRDLVDAESALIYFEKVKRLNPSLYQTNNLSDISRELTNDLALKNYKIARYYTRILKYPQAILRYKYLLTNYSNTEIAPLSFYRLIVLLLKADSYTEAEGYIRNMSLLYKDTKDYQKAVKKYDKYIVKKEKKELKEFEKIAEIKDVEAVEIIEETKTVEEIDKVDVVEEVKEIDETKKLENLENKGEN